jgi:bisphosphoglycerate-independent phosphoglycerate mutase (AlkP superfamily)
LHLIVGKKEGAKNKVEEIETIIKKNGIGEILSISGIKNIFIEANNLINVNKFVNCLALGKGKYYSTPEQALESNWHKDDFPPCVLVNSIKPITQLGDFDSLICFDYNAADLLPALRLIKNEYSKARKFLHVSTLVRSNEFFDIDGFFEPERDAKLCQWLNKKGLKQSYVADTASLPLLKEVVDNETAATKLVSITGFDGKSVRSYYDKLANCIFNNCEKNDMIFVGSGIIGEIAKAGHLAQTVAAVRILDVFLSLLIEKILISGGTLVLTSCFGGAEKVNIETRPNPTFFIVVSNLIRKKTPFSKKPILREGFIPNFTPNERFLFDASATILDIIGVEKPDFVSGKSFLQEIISKDYLYEN